MCFLLILCLNCFLSSHCRWLDEYQDDGKTERELLAESDSGAGAGAGSAISWKDPLGAVALPCFVRLSTWLWPSVVSLFELEHSQCRWTYFLLLRRDKVGKMPQNHQPTTCQAQPTVLGFMSCCSPLPLLSLPLFYLILSFFLCGNHTTVSLLNYYQNI